MITFVTEGCVVYIQIDVAGVPDELRTRLSLACGLLAADQLQVDMQTWQGRNCDVLVVDMQSGYGRLAYEVAKRRGLLILGFGFEGHDVGTPEICRLDRQAPVAAIARALTGMLLPFTAVEKSAVTGLLDICVRETGCSADLLARQGNVAVILRPAAGRIHARSVSDLLAAEARLLNIGWFWSLTSDTTRNEEGWHIAHSLDSFLVIACRRHHARLPLLADQTFRLNRWPDIVGLADDVDVLRVAALFHQSPWTVHELAQHIGIDITLVNAFCWAALAGGSMTGGEPQVVALPTRRMSQPAPSILQRVALHFGLKFGHEH
jgi:hypothetical protein